MVESGARTRSEVDHLYSKLVMLLVLRSGLGDPTDPEVLRQTAVVTQSVFSHQDLLKFMKQTRFDKKIQIRRLALLVAGVRIFNWDTHR